MSKLLLWLNILFFAGVCSVVGAWDHEVSIGYNSSKEIGYDYYNNGPFLNAKLYKFNKLDKTLVATLDGSVANWRATTSEHDHTLALGLSGALRAYFIAPENRKFNPFLSGSLGPVYLSSGKFGERDVGGHFSLQTTLGVGTEFSPKNNKQGFTASLQLVHYCNAGIYPVNRGINMLYVFSLGYMF